MSNTTLDRLHQELEEISSNIREKEEALNRAKLLGNRYSQRSDTGWLLSAFVDQAGTLLAVASGMKARKWYELIRKMEEELLLLKVDQKLKQKEIEAFAKQET